MTLVIIFGPPAFSRLSDEFRTRIMEEVAQSDLPGLIFTYVWSVKDEEDKAYVDKHCQIFRDQGREVFFVELFCELEERLRRNKTVERLSEKPSKRDVVESEKRLLEIEQKHVMNTDEDFYYPENYLKIDNTNLDAEVVAKRIRDEFQLV